MTIAVPPLSERFENGRGLVVRRLSGLCFVLWRGLQTVKGTLTVAFDGFELLGG